MHCRLLYPILTLNSPLFVSRAAARFDVQRSKKSKFTIATVRLVDFSGSVKRILFHFAKTSAERDEWVEFGSPRIAPLYSKVPRKKSKPNSKTGSAVADAATKESNGKIVSDAVAAKNGSANVKVAPAVPLKPSYGEEKASKAGTNMISGKEKITKPPKKRIKAAPSPVDPSDYRSFTVGGKLICCSKLIRTSTLSFSLASFPIHSSI